MTYFISAPFGNFLQYSSFAQGATCVTGTFTLKPRVGRFKQILKTLRYVPTEAGWAWRNQLGLRNPGIFKGIVPRYLGDQVVIWAVFYLCFFYK